MINLVINPNDYAFPVSDIGKDHAEGMTKREYFALIAMQGLLASGQKKTVAILAVELADQLIEELNKG